MTEPLFSIRRTMDPQQIEGFAKGSAEATDDRLVGFEEPKRRPTEANKSDRIASFEEEQY